MKRLTRLALSIAAAWLLPATALAAHIPFILDGNAGLGLLPGNENHVVNGSPGTGGILSSISFNTATNVLSIDIGWGSGNGFTDLTGTASAAHIHGPTASSAPAGFSQDAGVLYFISGQPGYSSSASNGGFTGTLNINPADVAALTNSQTYINVHTSLNGGGEIRGHLVAVPEPATLLLVALGLAVVGTRPRRSA